MQEAKIAVSSNFHQFINQAGMWVQLIALGRYPATQPFSFFVFAQLFPGERKVA